MGTPLILSLQVFRGLAALSVVGHHAALSTDAFVQRLPAGWMALFDLGALGVDFFFVLSGFIIMHSHRNEAGNGQAVGAYIYKRLARIFPAYWPVGLAVLGLHLVLPCMSASGGREFSYLSSILLMPADLPPALSVAWTLVHELVFYAMFMLWFVSRRVFGWALLLWAVALAATALAAAGPTGWLRYPLSLLNVEFMLGVVAAIVYGRAPLRLPSGMLVAGGGGLAGGALYSIYGGAAPATVRLGLALGLAVLMLGVVLREQQRPMAWPAGMLMLGNASYSLYLVHNPLLSITQRLAGRLAMNWPLAMLWGVGLSVVCGYAYYLWVERPALKLFRPRKRLRASAFHKNTQGTD